LKEEFVEQQLTERERFYADRWKVKWRNSRWFRQRRAMTMKKFKERKTKYKEKKKLRNH
jgi:hypothetical protein